MESFNSSFPLTRTIDISNEQLFLFNETESPSLWNRAIWYHESFKNAGDPRLKHLPLLSSPIPITIIILSYIYGVTVLGPQVMKTRQPFELKTILLVYNALMVALSTFMFISGGIYGWFGSYSYTCQPIDYSNSTNGVGMAYTAYIYYLSKIIELLDTVFFVLRKKFSQVTPLHVSHHTGMAVLMFVGVKFWPGGHGSFQGFANSFVHMFMYFYYFLAGMGPRFAHLLWWKKYMTQLQLAQFGVIFLHSFQLIFQPNCDYPRIVLYPYLSSCIYLTWMFINFYRKEYLKRQRNQKLLSQDESDQQPCLISKTKDGQVQHRTDMIDLRIRKNKYSSVFKYESYEEANTDEDDSCEDDEGTSKKVL